MSRLIVKNLSKGITADKLKNKFGEKGVVTDVQLKYTKDGKFRHFGFVGFKTREEAESALNYFNNTFLNATKIQVEFCSGLGDPNKPKAWSKYASDSSAYKQMHGEPTEQTQQDEPSSTDNQKKKKREKKKDKLNPKVKELLEKHKDDPLFAEFIETHTRNKEALWSNTALLLNDSAPITGDDDNKDEDVAISSKRMPNQDSGRESGASDSDESVTEEIGKIAKQKISDLEYLKKKTVKLHLDEDDQKNSVAVNKKSKKEKVPVEFFTVKLNGLTYKDKKKDLKEFFHPLKPKSIRLPRNIKGIAYVSFATEKEMKQALVKNRSFLSGNRILVKIYTKKVPSVDDDKRNTNWQTQEESLKNEESIAESGRIFIRNLSYTTTEEDLEKLFNVYGPTAEVTVPIDKMSRKPKGFALVTFVLPEHATKAYMELDGTVFQGRMLHLLPGKAKQSIEELMEKDGLTFKSKKMLKLKMQAGSSHNWNSLFLGQNAVADLIADKYNTTKDKVLDSRGNQSIAVRLALGETEIVSQTKDFLIESGVHLDAFNETPKQRSKTIILVKNLPAKTITTEIVELFKPHGELGRVVLPPSGITAIVEFIEPFEARNAFTRLAYTKFKNLPLYLEWAPFDTFEVPSAKKDDTPSTKQEADLKLGGGKNGKDLLPPEDTLKHVDEEEEEEDDPPEPDTMLFVKNLNFSTTEEEMKEHFKKCGPIHYVSVARKKNSSNPNQPLSLGYGFLQFKKKAAAEKALKTMQLVVLNGHSLELKRSNRTLPQEVQTTRQKAKIGKQTGSKILVRNIPFQATTHEVTDLFKTFGELKAVRLPKKMAGTGSHRGFAFVEFYTKNDSKRAFKALCQSTHLYGRRLVLEWAANVDDVDEIRKRTAEHFHTGPSNIKTLRKSTVNPEELEQDHVED